MTTWLELEVWQWFMGQAVVAAVIWGGFHADMKNMRNRLDGMEKLIGTQCARIDRLLEQHHK